MSLVRDPDAAARYAADPAQALADAHLTDVTSVDVQNLIPVVAESLSMSAPAHGLDAFGAEPASNVWASGAATSAFEAFDAFDDHVPVASVIDTDSAVPAIVDHLDDLPAALTTPDPAPSLQVDDVAFDHPAITEPAADDGWASVVDDLDHPVQHDPGFDLFD